MTHPKDKRSFEMSIALPATPEKVWRALTEEDGVTRWFSPKAQITPEPGGRVVWDWGDFGAFDTKVHIWEPGKRFAVLETKQDPTGEKVVHTIDFQLSDHGRTTLLTLVHSGFGPESHWDDEFEGISSGWTFELRALRIYLEHHQDQERHFCLWRLPSQFPPEETFHKVFGPQGFLAEGSIEGLREGAAYQMTSSWGDDFSGEVLVNFSPDAFAGKLAHFNKGILRYEREGSHALIGLQLWGDTADAMVEFETNWKTRITELLNPKGK